MRDFLGLAAAVIARDPGLAPCRATVEKELLHMEILEALRGIRAFPRLAFKGGTCLRLCRQGKRLSEDLDFAAGRDFDAAMMDDLEGVLRDRIASTYGLEVTVARRSFDRRDRDILARWVARVVTRPSPGGGTSNIGVQRVKIEVDSSDHPPGTSPTRAVFPYAHLVMPSRQVLVNAVPVAATLSDKLVALPWSIMHRRNPRYRDVWDLIEYLPTQTGLTSMLESARQRAAEQMQADQYTALLAEAGDRLPDVIADGAFEATMRRFLPHDLAENTIGNADYRRMMVESLQETFRWLRDPGSMPRHLRR
ncbi:MAG: nucleotidyl transferase AbiEii/AbiGii toxin family protein [Gammaproteobacteria bacterium]|nr:nucleotidyl transferase AbiEii/AbiGii toxin family protein [Gammaproteobacteria bacterium]